MEAKPWTMVEGLVTEYKIDTVIWIPKPNKMGNVKQCYFIKWLKQKKLGDVFMLDDFFKVYPKHKTDKHTRDRLGRTISELCSDKEIQQLGKDEFKVLRK